MESRLSGERIEHPRRPPMPMIRMRIRLFAPWNPNSGPAPASVISPMLALRELQPL